MRQRFSGYYDLSSEQYQGLWREAIIVIDTNVLLDMYRLSPEARDALFATLNSVKERLWIPYQVAKEYHRDYNDVIKGQAKKCEEVSAHLEQMLSKLMEDCSANRSYPYLNDKQQRKLKKVIVEITSDIEKEKKEIEQLLKENPRKNQIADLLDGKLGEELAEHELLKIFADGKQRYEAHIPPGYKDIKSKQGNDIYGDLIIWEEMIAYAKTNHKDVLFITSDTKEDWFRHINENQIQGPREELRMEFTKRTQQIFYAYTTSSFLRYAAKYIGSSKIPVKVLDEVASIMSTKNEAVSSDLSSDTYNRDYQFITGDISRMGETSSEHSES